jgi:VWFA-related protein
LHCCLGAWSLTAVGLGTAVAQTPSPTPFTFEVDLDVVSVTAVVYDKSGRFVGDLGPSDVEVFEDGVRQEVTLFRSVKGGTERIPLTVALVLDSSGSMRRNLHFLQEAANNFIYKLEEIDRAQVIQFNDSVKGSVEFTSDLDRLERFVDGLQAWGGTSLYDAIHYALNRIRDQPGRKALVVFSDGEDTTSSLTKQEVLDYASAVEVTVYTVGIRGATARGLVARSPRGFLRKIARQTGGAYFFPDKVANLLKTFQEISKELHQHYLLAYTPKRPPDETWREIEVKLKRKDLEVRVRKGYFAVRRSR